MRKFILLTGAAALAAAMPALAKGGPGGGGGGGPHGGGHGAQGRPGGGGAGGGGHGGQGHRGGGHGFEKPGGGGGHAQHGGGMAHAPAMHGPKAAAHAPHQQGERHGLRAAKPAKAERQAFRDAAERERFDRIPEDRFQAPAPQLGFVGPGNCPPGLAKKSPACVPPGQARQMRLGDRAQAGWLGASSIPGYYSSFYPETQDYYYRYDDNGYIYRVDRGNDLVSAIIPLFGGGFAVGQPLPAGYDVYNVPLQYRDVYQDSDDYAYRYGDNAIYRVDNQSGLIESVVALLTGDVNVGQRLPAGYDVYNLPMAYRDRYQDSDDSLYRYADGNIFQVDPKTMLVQAIIEKLI